ncbi:Beta-lactamase-like protein 2 [Smittium culicis]|uniref:Beta-lactamase-like protein 2 n=1 Tax=Smittium culicis TaxID=133412 RepID=A0A1R1X2Y2_9FUNG|nr:Beta-lactamase-like protein 2 [Smittium culicis]OMJ09351.1 Beta-lactamase-like protein 2 [Smittium culicis]OMJ24144.1 Beta-lactamase-like protein 2 [Smittium culicis]
MRAVQLSNLIWQVNAHNPGPFTLMGTNTFIVGTGKHRVLIDTGDGMQPTYFEELRSVLRDKMDDARISTILITHHHADHTGGISQLVNDPLIASSDLINQAKLSSPAQNPTGTNPNVGVFANIRGTDAFSKYQDAVNIYPLHSSPNLNKSFDHFKAQQHQAGTPDTEATAKFRSSILAQLRSPENFSISIAGSSDADAGACTISVLPTPGHTDDHVAFYLHEEHVMFSGDCILGSNSSSIFTNLRLQIQSLELLELLELAVICPGHGSIIDDAPTAQLRRSIDHRLGREQKIVDVIREFAATANSSPPGIEFDDLFLATYGKLDGEKLVRGAKFNLSNHLDKLIYENKIIKTVAQNSSFYKISAQL